MSKARTNAEIQHAIDCNDLTLLNKTKEGQMVLKDCLSQTFINPYHIDSDTIKINARLIMWYIKSTQVCNLEVYS